MQTQENINLINQSIEHWKRMRDDINCPERPGMADCPLCQRYAHDDMRPDEECLDCPVYKASGYRYCKETPYGRARHIWEQASKGYVDIAVWKQAAQAEIDFLESLKG